MANKMLIYSIDNYKILQKDSGMKLENYKPHGNKWIYGYHVPWYY